MRDGVTAGLRARILASFDGPGTTPAGTGHGAAWRETPADGSDPARPLTPAAVLIPLIDHADGMTVLLTRRTEHLKSHAGQISFPGGRMEHHDPSPEATALRETAEEIGLPHGAVELIGRLGVRETGTGYRVVPVVGLVAPPLDLAPDPAEVAEVFEVPLDFALDPANHRFETRVLAGVQRQFYAVPYDDYYIWGLTARLLVTLSELVGRG